MAVHLSRAAAAGKKQREEYVPPDYSRVADFHTNADTDSDVAALHHTLGSQSSQASPGDHNHDGGTSSPLWQGQSVTGARNSTAWATSVEALLSAKGASIQST